MWERPSYAFFKVGWSLGKVKTHFTSESRYYKRTNGVNYDAVYIGERGARDHILTLEGYYYDPNTKQGCWVLVEKV